MSRWIGDVDIIKQKTACEMRIGDGNSDVYSSELLLAHACLATLDQMLGAPYRRPDDRKTDPVHSCHQQLVRWFRPASRAMGRRLAGTAHHQQGTKMPQPILIRHGQSQSTEEHRVGKECVSKCSTRWSTSH